MQLTDKQLEEIQVFNENEVQKIVSEFLYYNEKQEDMKEEDPFLEQELQPPKTQTLRIIQQNQLSWLPSTRLRATSQTTTSKTKEFWTKL